jgi:hypothetical protein
VGDIARHPQADALGANREGEADEARHRRWTRSGR